MQFCGRSKTPNIGQKDERPKALVPVEFEILPAEEKRISVFLGELDLGKASSREPARLLSGFPVVRVPMKMHDCEDETRSDSMLYQTVIVQNFR